MKILKIVPSDFKQESRDLREITALRDAGHKVVVNAFHKEATYRGQVSGIDIVVFNVGFWTWNNILGKLLRYGVFIIKVILFSKRFKPDAISAHDLQCLVIGEMIRVFSGKKIILIYDSHELTTEMAINNHLPKWMVFFQKKVEKILIGRSDKVMVVCDSIADFNNAHFKLKERPTVVRNIPELSQLNEAYQGYFHRMFNITTDKVILLYQGAVSKGRGIGQIIKALPLLPEKFVLVIVGPGNYKEYKSLAVEEGVGERVYFAEAVSYSELANVTSAADLGICLIENYCLSYYYSLPNKLFEYIQSEIPIVASNFPEMSAVINKYNVGVACDPAEIGQIADSVMFVASNRTEYGEKLKKAKVELCWEEEKRLLLEMYQDAFTSCNSSA